MACRSPISAITTPPGGIRDVPADGNMDFRHFVHCAKLAERGKFDLIFLADSSAVRDLDNLAIARDMEHQLVKHEPMALLAAMSTVTSRVGPGTDRVHHL